MAARELIFLHVGHSGARIGDAAWALALEEHGARAKPHACPAKPVICVSAASSLHHAFFLLGIADVAPPQASAVTASRRPRGPEAAAPRPTRAACFLT